MSATKLRHERVEQKELWWIHLRTLKNTNENKDHKNHENGSGWNRTDTCMTAAIIHESLTVTGNVVIAQEMAMTLYSTVVNCHTDHGNGRGGWHCHWLGKSTGWLWQWGRQDRRWQATAWRQKRPRHHCSDFPPWSPSWTQRCCRSPSTLQPCKLPILCKFLMWDFFIQIFLSIHIFLSFRM